MICAKTTLILHYHAMSQEPKEKQKGRDEWVGYGLIHMHCPRSNADLTTMDELPYPKTCQNLLLNNMPTTWRCVVVLFSFFRS